MQIDEAPPASGVGPVLVPRRRRSAQQRPPYFLMWPSLALLIFIVGVPFLSSIYTSMTALNQYTIAQWWKAPFVGLQNYIDGLTQGSVLGASLLQSMWASVSFSVGTTALILPIGIGAALLMNAPFRGRALVRSIFLIPYVMPGFVTAIIFRLIFINGWGPFDRLLSALNIASINTFWLIGPNSFWAMVLADTWASWPFIYLMTLAGLQQVSHELYEAAEMDGASALRRFTSITLPLLRPILALAVLLSTLNHFNNFNLPYIMFGATPPVQVAVLPLTVYLTSFSLINLGSGAAMSLMTLLVFLVPAIFYIRIVRLGEQST